MSHSRSSNGTFHQNPFRLATVADLPKREVARIMHTAHRIVPDSEIATATAGGCGTHIWAAKNGVVFLNSLVLSNSQPPTSNRQSGTGLLFGDVYVLAKELTPQTVLRFGCVLVKSILKSS